MGIGQINWRKALLIWAAATLLWTAAAAPFFPLQDATSAIWRDAPNAAEQVSMFNVADKSFWLCMQQRPPPAKNAEVTRDRARESHCNSLKDFLYGQIIGMPRDLAWRHVGRFAAAAVAGALAIAALMLTASRLARRPHRAER